MARAAQVAKGDQKSGPSQKSRRRHGEVIEAAVKMFHENGYSDTSVEDIANELGILKGSLYYYITSKEDLLYEIVRGVNRDVAALLGNALERTDLPPLERLTSYIVAQVAYNASNVKKITVYYDDLPLLGSRRLKEIRHTLHEIEQDVTGLIAEAKERGDIESSVDPGLATYAVFANVNWMYRWYKPRGQLRPAQIGKFIAQFTLNGLTGAQTSVEAA